MVYINGRGVYVSLLFPPKIPLRFKIYNGEVNGTGGWWNKGKEVENNVMLNEQKLFNKTLDLA